MSKLSSTDQSVKAKKNFQHPLVQMLEQPMTKQQISECFDCSNREAREMVAECAMYFPIIALSSNSKPGYRRARDIATLNDIGLNTDIDDAKQMIRELNSRVKCLKKRMKPLIAWLKVAEKEAKRRNEQTGN